MRSTKGCCVLHSAASSTTACCLAHCCWALSPFFNDSSLLVILLLGFVSAAQPCIASRASLTNFSMHLPRDCMAIAEGVHECKMWHGFSARVMMPFFP